MRALAVGLVVLFHLWPRRLTGGYIGVDVFFVISGYLITSHMLREVVSTGRLRPVRFWARRIRRLLPASFLVLLLSGVGVALFAPATEWRGNLRALTASALYVQNWSLAFDAVDYMAKDNVPTAAQHYWSLSVEEQFYAVWPLLILALLWWAKRRRTKLAGAAETARIRTFVLWGLLAIVAASLTWSIVSTRQDQAFAYFSTLTRAWEFAAGGVVAALGARPHARFALVGGWLSVAAIVITGALYTEASPFPGWIAAIPVFATCFLLFTWSSARASASALFSLRPLVFLGDISYSIYLFHWPLIVIVPWVTGHKLTWPEKLVVGAVTIGAAYLSKRFVEDPLRTGPLLAARPWRAYVFAAAGALVFLGAHVALTQVMEARQERVQAEKATRMSDPTPCLGPGALAPGCGEPHGKGPLLVDAATVGQQSHLPIYARCQQSLASGALKSCELGELTAPVRTVALLGDSHAGALVPLMDSLGKERKWRVIAMTKGSCPMSLARRVLPGESSDERARACEAFNDAALAKVLADPSISEVFVTQFRGAYSWTARPDLPLADPAKEGSLGVWQRLQAAGKKVTVLADVPVTGGKHIPSCVASHPSSLASCDLPRTEALPADALVALAAARAGVRVVDLTDSFCDARRCYAVLGDVIVYRDKSHLSEEFARLLAPVMSRALTQG